MNRMAIFISMVVVTRGVQAAQLVVTATSQAHTQQSAPAVQKPLACTMSLDTLKLLEKVCAANALSAWQASFYERPVYNRHFASVYNRDKDITPFAEKILLGHQQRMSAPFDASGPYGHLKRQYYYTQMRSRLYRDLTTLVNRDEFYVVTDKELWVRECIKKCMQYGIY